LDFNASSRGCFEPLWFSSSRAQGRAKKQGIEGKREEGKREEGRVKGRGKSEGKREEGRGKGRGKRE